VAHYRDHSQEQARLVPISLLQQIQAGTIEYTINYLVDCEVDLSVFESHYHNDATGAPAIHPSILLKVVLFAYSRGITSSRRIARCCEENVVFMALAADTRPHFTTIAEFVSSMSEAITFVFRDILTVCYTEGLIGNRMFAVDGCKIASNCAKEWSGTKKELMKKAAKIETSVRFLLQRHRDCDGQDLQPGQKQREQRAIDHLQAKAAKIRGWLRDNPERLGSRGKPIKSNLTDPDSAKMVSGHGVIQGYTGVAVVDDSHQVVLDAEAFGDGHEAPHLEQVLDSLQQTFIALQASSEVLKQVVLTADSGFHSEQTVKMLLERGLDAYVADTRFRLRDPRFANLQQHRSKTTDSKHTSRARKYFSPADFPFDESGTLLCPAGHPLKCTCKTYRSNNGFHGRLFKADSAQCSSCALRSRCMRKSHTPARQVVKLEKAIRHNGENFTQRMIQPFDSSRGRLYYSRRMGTVEPVFANIRSTLGLDRFSLRGRRKVDAQWKLFCTVHNIGKLARYGRWAKN
jgi:transposase